jgi:hypothetical protein
MAQRFMVDWIDSEKGTPRATNSCWRVELLNRLTSVSLPIQQFNESQLAICYFHRQILQN